MGYDVKYTLAGSEELLCSVCCDKMDVRRGLQGFSGRFSGLMPDETRKTHDEFLCPNRGFNWHRQAIALLEMIEETPSKRMEDILREELEQVVALRIATKTDWGRYV